MKNTFNNLSLSLKITILFTILIAVLLTIYSLSLFLIKKQESMSYIKLTSSDSCKQLTDTLSNKFSSLIEEMLLLNEYVAIDERLFYSDPGDDFDEASVIQLQKYVNTINMKNNNFQLIDSIIIHTKKNQSFLYLSDRWDFSNTALTANINEILPLNTLTTHWTGITDSSRYFTTDSSEVVSFITPFFPVGNRDNVVILNLSVNSIENYLQQYFDEIDIGIIIDCNDGTYITSDDPTALLLKDTEFLKSMRDSYTADEGIFQGAYLINSAQMIPTKWQVVTITDYSSITASISSYMTLPILLVLGVFLTLSILIHYVIRSLIQPLKELSSIMEESGIDGHLHLRVPIKSNDEIGTFSKGYNDMMDRIVSLNSDLLEKEKEKRIDEIKLMQMQIKPHFLYNALESAKFMVEMGDPKGGEMISSIAHFYKLTLSGISEKVPIQEEIQQLKHYLSIQNMRYASIFDYTIIENNIDVSNYIVKFTLQPIVENAIYHGLKPRQHSDKGLLTIEFQEDQEKVYIFITDNGVGMNEEQLEILEKRLSNKELIKVNNVGLYNVNRRLILAYGDEYRLRFTSQKNKFTKITVTIPKTRRKDSNV